MADKVTDSSTNYMLLTRLAEGFAARYRAGERPPFQEYIDRYPELADDIRELFQAMVEIEQVREDHQEPAGQEAAPPAGARGRRPDESAAERRAASVGQSGWRPDPVAGPQGSEGDDELRREEREAGAQMEDGAASFCVFNPLSFCHQRLCQCVWGLDIASSSPTISGEFFVPFFVLVMNHEHKE